MLNLDGREIGGCKLIRKIGAGGMGEVYLAEQLRVGNRQVAVKIVSLDDAALRSQDAEDVAKRFQREAATLGGLSHPNILPVHDSDHREGDRVPKRAGGSRLSRTGTEAGVQPARTEGAEV